MTRVLLAGVGLAGLLLTGCSGEPSAAPAPTVTVTATQTVTETATPSQSPVEAGPGSTTDPARELVLTVHTDGCGVIRPETGPGEYHNLTWSVRDADGFQVLGRNAQGETRYRYYRGGTYTVVLEAWGDATGAYVPVSNEVTIRC